MSTGYIVHTSTVYLYSFQPSVLVPTLMDPPACALRQLAQTATTRREPPSCLLLWLSVSTLLRLRAMGRLKGSSCQG